MEEHFKYNANLSNKLNIILFSLVNSNIYIKNDPISDLINNYSEIELILELKNLTKFLFFQVKKINNILYQYDKIIKIKDSMTNDISSNFYLILLIKAESELINYEYSANYINIFNKNNNNNENNYYFKLIKSKIIIELINNFRNCDSFSEEADDELISKLESESKENIRINLNVLKEINLDLNEDDIYEKNIGEFYADIIKAIIKDNKLSNYDYSYNIFNQLDLEHIDIPFMENEILFRDILETLNPQNLYINNYIINTFDDINDINKVNFYFLLLKYVFKSSLYIYHVPILFQLHNKLLEFLNLKEYFTLTISNQILIGRIEFIIRKLCDNDYYYFSKYLFKNNNSEKENNNIILNILKYSICIFNIAISTKINPTINDIECIYEKDKKITFDEMINLLNKKREENNSELNKNYILFLNYLNNYKTIIENKVSDFKFDYNFKIHYEFKSIGNIYNNNFNLDVVYKVINHPFFETNFDFSDNNILSKKYNEFEGFNSLMDKLCLKTDPNYDPTLQESTIVATKIGKTKILNELSTLYINNNQKNNNDNDMIFFDESEFKIIEFENIIYKHEKSVKYFLNLFDEYYLSCGDDKLMILYDKDLKILQKIPNPGEILYHISLKSNNEKYMELIACYGKNIYLINVEKENNYKYNTKMYEIPDIKTLFCVKVSGENYVVAGLNMLMNILDIFNDNLEGKKMFKYSSASFNNGLVINSDYVALISNELFPNGSNKLVICNLKQHKIEYAISGYSFNIFNSSLSLIKIENHSNLLVACRKYNSSQKNGVLVADMNLVEEENIKYKFYDTQNFEVYCFMQILNTYFIFIGGFDSEKRIGMIKLYKLCKESENEIIHVQDIDVFEENDDFKGFKMPVSNIYQTKDFGKIIITTLDGSIYLFSKPNLDLYIRTKKGK